MPNSRAKKLKIVTPCKTGCQASNINANISRDKNTVRVSFPRRENIAPRSILLLLFDFWILLGTVFESPVLGNISLSTPIGITHYEVTTVLVLRVAGGKCTRMGS